MRRLVNSLPKRILFIILAGLLLLAVPSLYAEPPLVTSDQDTVDTLDNLCTLREAILTANGTLVDDDCASGNNITFAAGITEIIINSGAPLPPLTAGNITIDGTISPTEIVTISGAVGADDGLTIQSASNVISNVAIVSFPGNGIVIEGAAATGNTLSGLYVGTNVTLLPGLGNGGNGIIIRGGAQNNQVGISPVTVETERNTIASNALNGVEISGIDTTGNTILASNIGIRPDFASTLPNGQHGVLIAAGATNNGVGTAGAALLDQNVISGNTLNGVAITGAGTNGNQVIANRIGVNLSSNTSSFPNANGVSIGTTAQQSIVSDNVIAGNTVNGVLIDTLATGNTIGNNNLIARNGTSGVTIIGAAANTVNGNVIEANTFNGVTILGNGTNNNVISQNTIRNNTQDGVVITGAVTGNTVTQNSISANGQLGINLGDNGATPNDAGDVDAGPNEFQNFPQSLLALDNGTNTLLGGVMDGGVNTPFTVEAFSNVAPESEGTTFQGAGTTPNGAFTLTLPSGIVPETLTTTATSSTGSTSEFSPPVQIIQLQAAFTANPVSGFAPLTVNFTDATVVNPPGTPLTYTWDFGDGTATSNAQNPSHLYTTAGLYTVTLTVCITNGTVTLCDDTTLTIEVLAPSPTPSQTPTATFTLTPGVPTNTPPAPSTPLPPTITAVTPTNTPVTVTVTPFFTRTPTFTNTLPPTATPTFTRTFTATFTATLTRTPTITPSLTPTFTQTFTRTPTLTITPSQTSTPTPQPTNTPLPTNTFTPTATPPIQVTVIKEPVDDDTFTIIVDNEGGDLTNLVVEEQLRPGVIYLSSQPGSPLCRQNAGVISCTVGTLPNGEAFEVDIDVDAEGVDIVSGQTSVRSDTFGTTIDEAYILKSSQPPFAAPGEQVTYTIRVINPTSRTITGVAIRDRMPDAVEIESASSDVGQIQQTGQDIALNVASLAPGGRITITIVGRLREGDASPQIANRACLTTTGVTRPRCAVAGFVRANALPSTGEPQILPYIIGGLAVLMSIGTSVFIFRQQRMR